LPAATTHFFNTLKPFRQCVVKTNPMRSLRDMIVLLVLAQLLADAPLASALWELPAVNLFSPPEPFEFSS
jgi:hypothetical protein